MYTTPREPYIKNTLDKRQRKRAVAKENMEKKNNSEDMMKVLETFSGRRIIWKLIEHCRVNESIWEPSAKIHYNAGRQDVGHYLQYLVGKTDDDYSKNYYMTMVNEARKGNYDTTSEH